MQKNEGKCILYGVRYHIAKRNKNPMVQLLVLRVMRTLKEHNNTCKIMKGEISYMVCDITLQKKNKIWWYTQVMHVDGLHQLVYNGENEGCIVCKAICAKEMLSTKEYQSALNGAYALMISYT